MGFKVVCVPCDQTMVLEGAVRETLKGDRTPQGFLEIEAGDAVIDLACPLCHRAVRVSLPAMPPKPDDGRDVAMSGPTRGA